MSDKLRQDFDLYYKELENFTGHYKNGSQQIETDKMLSKVGKSEKISELKQEHLKNVNDLAERFNSDFDERVRNLNDRVEGKKHDSILDSIKKKFLKGGNLSSDETNRLLLYGMGETKTIMEKSNFQQMLSGADIEQIRKTTQSLADNKDIEQLTWLKELTDLGGQELLSSTIQAQVDGIRDEGLSEEKKSLKIVSEKIEKGIKLFEYSLERSKTGVFVDARQDAEV